MNVPFCSFFFGLVVAGCGQGSVARPDTGPAGLLFPTSTGALADASAVSSAASGLPCDIFALLQSHCMACHSSPPAGGVPMPLETLADLSAPARSDPTKTVAQVCLTRMQAANLPMPPTGQPPLSSQGLTAFQAWVNAGAMPGTCDGTGADGAAPIASPYDTPVQCSSGITSTTREGSRMRPGDACVSCHAQSGGEAPLFSMGGTVYKTAHEPTQCDGVNVAGASVVITDANDRTLTIAVNSVGNFYSSTSIATPFHAKVVYNGAERVMAAAQTSGDCDSCHTESGASNAPGRIMLP